MWHFKLFSLFLLIPLKLFSAPIDTNVLVYEEAVQISVEINSFENLVAGTPIIGSIMITHNSDNPVDVNSFKMGDNPLKVQFIKSASMSSFSKLVISIYQFQLPARKTGRYQLPPIKVKVGKKSYEAPLVTIQVN